MYDPVPVQVQLNALNETFKAYQTNVQMQIGMLNMELKKRKKEISNLETDVENSKKETSNLNEQLKKNNTVMRNLCQNINAVVLECITHFNDC